MLDLCNLHHTQGPERCSLGAIAKVGLVYLPPTIERLMK